MKVVVIFCVKAFYDDLKQIYNKAEISAYSEFDVKGYTKKKSDKSNTSNWFGSGKDHYDSAATFTFLEEEKATDLFKQIEKFNLSIKCCSPMHAYVLDVEKFI
ncbi:hypothetical protein ACT3CE_09930 [Marinifilum sp. RC60d5]|uniref:hypothetical protein n=1 Tax=Marinifilum sp. RC60d5 TaxID=3458414 RepID=UPI0040350874